MRALSNYVVVMAAAAAVIVASEAVARPGAPVAPGAPRFAAVAFDYLALFNPDSVVAAADRVAPRRGLEFTRLWRTRQFEYCWLRSITNRYVDFAAVTEDALVYTADAMQIAMTPSQTQALLDAYQRLDPWPDTESSLRRLRRAGVRIVTLTNFSPPVLRSNTERAGLLSLFDALVSTHVNHTYKPDPRAYQLAVDRLEIPKEQIVFAAFAGWDAVGAKSFGYPTVWVNRSHQAAEELGIVPDRTVNDLNGLLDFVLAPSPSPPFIN